jgi:endonuclease/exonuclease/phosphatase (EEP) superfamily protein YafD
LEAIARKLDSHTGPLILAGDFNGWNSSRAETIEIFRHRLGLRRVPFEARHLKSFGGYPLDLLFYRELQLEASDVLPLEEYSDHNPLLAKFSL